jgi:F0F1-type ATP synthase gamma subunit
MHRKTLHDLKAAQLELYDDVMLEDEKKYDAVILLTGSRGFCGDTHIHLGER